MATNYDSINAQLRNDPGYQAARAGRVNVGQFPTGPDGLVLPNFREMNARYYAQKKYGQNSVGGAQNKQGDFYDPNADHWYSDPRVLGPIAVGAAGGLAAGGLLPGAAQSAAAGGAGAPTAVPSMPWTIPAGFEASMGAAPPALGSVAPTVAGGAAGAGAKTLAGSIKDKLLSPSGIAGIGGLIAALMANRGNGETSAAQEALLNEALKRSQRVDPLHQAVTQLAFSRLPISAREGISLMGK